MREKMYVSVFCLGDSARAEPLQPPSLQQHVRDLRTEVINNRTANRQMNKAILRQGQEFLDVLTDFTGITAAQTDPPAALQSRVSDDSGHDTNGSSDVEAGVLDSTKTLPDSQLSALSTSENIPATAVPGVRSPLRSSASDSLHNVQQSGTAV